MHGTRFTNVNFSTPKSTFAHSMSISIWNFPFHCRLLFVFYICKDWRFTEKLKSNWFANVKWKRKTKRKQQHQQMLFMQFEHLALSHLAWLLLAWRCKLTHFDKIRALLYLWVTVYIHFRWLFRNVHIIKCTNK